MSEPTAAAGSPDRLRRDAVGRPLVGHSLPDCLFSIGQAAHRDDVGLFRFPIK